MNCNIICGDISHGQTGWDCVSLKKKKKKMKSKSIIDLPLTRDVICLDESSLLHLAWEHKTAQQDADFWTQGSGLIRPFIIHLWVDFSPTLGSWMYLSD